MQGVQLLNKDYPGEMKDELRPEYDLRELLKGGVRGRYAARCRAGASPVLLDPDVARAFPDQTAVNEVLRLVTRSGEIQHSQKHTPAGAGT